MSRRADDGPGIGEMLGEIIDLSAGLGVLLLPALAISLPGVILFVILPAVLLFGALLAPLALAGAAAAPVMAVRALRRRRRHD